METCIFRKSRKIDSYKIVSQLKLLKIKINLAHDTIHRLNFVAQFLNKKMKEKSVEIIYLQLFSSLQWDPV